MSSKILAKIAIIVSGLLGLPAILYVFGGASVFTGSSIGNEALVDNGLTLIALGTFVLMPILLYMFLIKSRR